MSWNWARAVDRPRWRLPSWVIRCYSPADLRLLLPGTGLQLQRVKPGGTVDWTAGKWLPVVPLGRSMQYVAELRLV